MEFKQLQATAKQLGINCFGMSKEKLMAAIEAKTGNKVDEALEGENIKNEPEVTTTTETNEVKRKPGRPIKEGSARQIKLAEWEAKKAAGEFKLGRPVVEGSARQIKLAEMKARAEANGGVVKRGRPVDTTSKAYLKKMERQAKIDAGIELKPGRPKMIKIDVEAQPKTEITTEVTNEVTTEA